MAAWAWDDELQAALCTMPAYDSKEFLTILENNFSHCWDNSSIDSAPENIRYLADQLGGMKDGQLIFSSSTDIQKSAIGAFWPWQHDDTVSVRIFSIWNDNTNHENDEVLLSFNHCLGND